MRSFAWFMGFLVLLIGCNNSEKENVTGKDNRIVLRTDSINIVQLSDTMLIYEGICRGCEYEGSVRFEINDSLGIVKMLTVISKDDNPEGMAGGNVGKELVLVPVKTGITTIRLYKLLSYKTAKEDSARVRTYTIEVKK